MGDSGSRRCTLVSRLPIFRKSISRRHDSLPSSPSSSNTAGVHSSSPSSTNSSSGSTGKRRSIFRAPSISFHHKKGSEPKPELTDQNLSISNGAQPSHSNMLSLEEQVKTRGRHSVGFSSSRSKKITRSLTEDFEREKEPSTNKNVFINCLSSGRSEGDDSGFTEEQSRRSIKQSTKKLLPKSFSSHYKFSKSVPVPQSQSTSLVQQPEFSLAIAQYQEQEPALGRPSPPCSVDVTERAGSSLQSPLLSADLTTAQTPSEFLALTEDSLSEADAFPKSGSTASHCCDNFGHNDATSQPTPSLTAVTKTKMESVGTASCTMMSPGRYRLEGRCSTELQSSPETPAANQREALQSTEPSVRNASDPETHLPAHHQRVENPLAHAGELMLRTSSPRTLGSYDQHKTLAEHFKGIHPVSDSRVIPSSGDHHVFNKTSYGYEASAAKVLASSLSPYREGRYIERRLRSSSEGTAGSGRMVLKPKDGHVEASSLRKHRTGSSSSKMNSLDVLNHLGSCELDEDDLMLDLEFLEEQNLQPPVCREDSCHSVMSCAAVLLSPVDPAKEMNMNMLEEPKCPEPSKQSLSLKITKDTDQEARCSHVSRMPNSPSTDWPLQGVEENGGIDSLPFRLMLQECTAVKTLLLKMKRVLQESDVSPSSSTTSLPISPLTEEPLPFKDVMKDECSMLRLQLKDRDELISHLRAELEKVQHLQKAFASRVDKSTQTELLGCDGLSLKRLEAVQGGRETTHRNRTMSQSHSTRDRKAIHTPTEDRFRYSAADPTSPYKNSCQLPGLCLSNFLKDKELGGVMKHTRGSHEAVTSEMTQNSRTMMGQSFLKPAAKPEGLSMFSEKPKDPAALSRQHSTFTGRFGQPPRGPISLHTYSRKNVFLQHNLHTTEFQTLGQQDG